jgi:hypothetical protein
MELEQHEDNATGSVIEAVVTAGLGLVGAIAEHHGAKPQAWHVKAAVA